MPPSCLYPGLCVVEKEFVPSCRWEVEFPSVPTIEPLNDRLDHFMRKRKIPVPTHRAKFDTTFDLVVGPVFSHSAVKYSNCDQNIALALVS